MNSSSNSNSSSTVPRRIPILERIQKLLSICPTRDLLTCDLRSGWMYDGKPLVDLCNVCFERSNGPPLFATAECKNPDCLAPRHHILCAHARGGKLTMRDNKLVVLLLCNSCDMTLCTVNISLWSVSAWKFISDAPLDPPAPSAPAPPQQAPFTPTQFLNLDSPRSSAPPALAPAPAPKATVAAPKPKLTALPPKKLFANEKEEKAFVDDLVFLDNTKKRKAEAPVARPALRDDNCNISPDDDAAPVRQPSIKRPRLPLSQPKQQNWIHPFARTEEEKMFRKIVFDASRSWHGLSQNRNKEHTPNPALTIKKWDWTPKQVDYVLRKLHSINQDLERRHNGVDIPLEWLPKLYSGPELCKRGAPTHVFVHLPSLTRLIQQHIDYGHKGWKLPEPEPHVTHEVKEEDEENGEQEADDSGDDSRDEGEEEEEEEEQQEDDDDDFENGLLNDVLGLGEKKH